MMETTLGNGLLLLLPPPNPRPTTISLNKNEQNSIQQIRNKKDNHNITPSDKKKT